MLNWIKVRLNRARLLRIAAIGLVALVLMTPVGARIAAQSAYKTANSHTSIIPRKYGFFSADFAEAGLGLTFVGEWGTWCDFGECEDGGFGFTGYVSGSGRKGQGDIFSDFDFAPGVEVGGRVYYAFGQTGARYEAVYLTFGYRAKQLRLAELDPATTVLRFDERYQQDVLGSVGFNHVFGAGTAIGIRGDAWRELGSPGFNQPSEVCVPGTFPGSGVVYTACSNRYVRNTFESLPDLWGGQVRMDVTLAVAEIGFSNTRPTVALVAGGSADFLESANAMVSLGVGVAIMPASYPGQSIVTVLAGLNDAFDANGVAPSFNDRFVVSLALGIPFPTVLRR
jgi:hypothetical protein